MNGPQRIGVFYSIKHAFENVLIAARGQYPDARITAIVPRGYAMSEKERALVDDVVETDSEKYRITDLGGFFGLVRLVRRGNYDVFIVLFLSIRHRVIAAASGAPRCESWALDGQRRRLASSVPGAVFEWLLTLASGQLAYARAWAKTHLRRAR